MKNDLSKLAMAGILGGGLVFGSAGCGSTDGSKPVVESQYSEIHDCAGKNTCKGLGGCKVTQAKLESMAKAAGTPMEKAGAPHDCAGMNSCQGLGGCSVDAKKLATLKSK